MTASRCIVACALAGLILFTGLGTVLGSPEHLTMNNTTQPWEFSTCLWTGERTRVGSTIHVIATLSISEASSDAFRFELLASSGAHIGQIKGTAKIVGPNRAIFIGENGCRLTFHLEYDTVTIQATSGCQWYAGMGVYFDGEYQTDARIVQLTLKDKGIFETEAQERTFQSLVGSDYPLFLQNTHLVFKTDDLDGFGMEVYEVGVRGVFTIMGAIYMIGSEGRLWAALINEDTIKVYTNERCTTTRLPKTIERWLTKVPERRLVFISSPQHELPPD